MDTAISVIVDETRELLSKQYSNIRNLKNARLVLDYVEVIDKKLKDASSRGGVDLPEFSIKRLQNAIKSTRRLLDDIEQNETYNGPAKMLGRYSRRIKYANRLKSQEEVLATCFESIGLFKEVDKMIQAVQKKPGDILRGDALRFWESVGDSMEVRMDSFWSRYKEEYDDEIQLLGPRGKATVLKWVRTNDEEKEVSVYTFESAVCEFGFPFTVSEEAQKLREDDLTVADRLVLTKHLNELIEQWEHLTFREKIDRPIRKAVHGIKDRREKEMKAKKLINGWYRKLNADKDEDEYTQIEQARRAWNYFFIRFSVLWQLSNFSHDLFRAFDFPGTARVRRFIKICELMDEANYRICIKQLDGVDESSPEWKKAVESWERHRPKVYAFLRAWLVEKRVDADKIPQKVLLGGQRVEC